MKMQMKDVWKFTKKKRERLIKRYIIYITEKKEVLEHFGRMMNQDVNGNKKLFWKELSNAYLGKVESCSIIKD